ncbi:MAG TPA: hypothetical protein V6D19_16845 [Stenomitos sp.]
MSTDQDFRDPTETMRLQFAQLQQERDQALEAVARWRRRYEVEAQQRRAEAEQAEQTIQGLRAELLQLCQLGPQLRSTPQPLSLPASSDLESEPLERLKLEVSKLQQERDRLSQALEQEQQQHAKTRENLIAALGEALQRRKS